MWGLKELPLPESISWFPETYGWTIASALTLCFCSWIGLRYYRAWKRQGYRRQALAQLAEMTSKPETLEALPHLLRSTALAAFPRDEVASLRGEPWTEWLNASGAHFTADDALTLDRLTYQPKAAEELAPTCANHLLAESRAFVRGHRARL